MRMICSSKLFSSLQCCPLQLGSVMTPAVNTAVPMSDAQKPNRNGCHSHKACAIRASASAVSNIRA